jgi:colanic acid/amylovoran biosynthesis protein
VLKLAFGDNIQVLVLDAYGSIPQRYYPELTFRQAYMRRDLLGRAIGRLDISKLQPRMLQWLATRSMDRLLPRTLRDNLDAFRSANLIVSAGGTYLVEHYRLELNLLQLALAVSTGNPTVMFTQSLGPFRNGHIRSWVQRLFPKMAIILLRDQQSFQNLEDAKVSRANARIMPDAAFALADIEQLEMRSTRPQGARLRVAISVRSWDFPGHPRPQEAVRNYRASISRMVAELVRQHDAEITMISTCQGVSEYRYDDSIVARDIASSLARDVAQRVTINSDFHSPEELKDIFHGFDFVIATRMHAAILALCSGTPVLPIAYEFKTKELFEGLGGGEWVLDIGSMQPQQCIALLDRFVAKLDEVRDDMIPRIVEQHKGAMAAVDGFRAIGQIQREDFQ